MRIKMTNKYLEKIAANKATKYVMEKTMPYFKNIMKEAPPEELKKGIAAMKNSIKMGLRDGTGGLSSNNTSTFKDSFKSK